MNNNNDLENNTGVCSCDAMGYKDVNVYVPVTVKPYGFVGDVTTEC